jgi:hydroxymethylpyrimidine/phosphomethylpyrimidine kinase
LLSPDAVAALRETILPLAEIITPNLPEAEVLLNCAPIRTLTDMRTAARALHALGPRIVVLKGGHLPGTDSIDVIDTGTAQFELPAVRIVTKNTHGTGCTLSAAIAALLPQHADPLAALRAAKSYLTSAIAASGQLSVGSGHGPVHHFHALWPQPPS